MIRAIRGATQVDADDPALILAATKELMAELLDRNGVDPDDVISLLFTTTPDLRSTFPAAAMRGGRLGDVPMMCATEIDVPSGLTRVVRVMAHVESPLRRAEIRHVYLRGASVLRPDLVAQG